MVSCPKCMGECAILSDGSVVCRTTWCDWMSTDTKTKSIFVKSPIYAGKFKQGKIKKVGYDVVELICSAADMETLKQKRVKRVFYA